MRRRILQIIATLDRAGAARQLALLAAGLPRDEFDVHVAALIRGGPLAADLQQAGIPLTVIGQQSTFDPPAWWRLRGYIGRLKPEVVQTWMFMANVYGRTAARSAGVRPLVAVDRSVDCGKTWQRMAVDRYLARSTAAIVVNSRGMQQSCTEQGLPAGKLRLIHNGIGPAPPSDTTREKLLEELALPPGARIIGAVGRLSRQRRIKDLIWATDLLHVIRDDAHLLVIGEGPQRQALERYARLCHVDERVHFLGARQDVPRLMPHFDLLWLARGYEGSPTVIMEAMVCGVPVVASDISGHRELIIHEETGFLVRLGDRAALARYANKILDDAQLAARLGAAGKERMGAEFSVAAMVERHAALYRELLG
jgi:glycosyltransferase involved in cell wall biosynthesis